MASKKDDKDPADRQGANESGAPPGREAMEAGRETAEAAGRAGQRMARRGVAEASEIGQRQTERLRSLLGASGEAYGDLAENSRGDVDAIMETGAKLAKGMQDVGWEVMRFTQNSLRMQMRAANDMMTCRSVEDVVQLQQDFLRESMDTFLNESARLLEMSSSVATDALHPINERAGQRQ